MGQSIHFSNTTNLREVIFGTHLNPEWISCALRSITHDHRVLQRITIRVLYLFYNLDPRVVDRVEIRHPEADMLLQAWSELDGTLVQLRESLRIYLKVSYRAPSHLRGRRATAYLNNLLPGATTGEMVEIAIDA